MKWFITGLGNPDPKYVGTKHNIGRDLVFGFAEELGGVFSKENKYKAEVANISIGKEKVLVIIPDVFMNDSGKPIAHFVKTKKDIERLIVVHDDLDLPIGSIKIGFGRGPGGHKGVISIIKHLKTKDFIRVRVGIASPNSKGVAKKLKDEDKVVKFVLSGFKKDETLIVKKTLKKIKESLKVIVSESLERAMNEFN